MTISPPNGDQAAPAAEQPPPDQPQPAQAPPAAPSSPPAPTPTPEQPAAAPAGTPPPTLLEARPATDATKYRVPLKQGAVPGRFFYDPAEQLDPVSKRILEIELANGPGLSSTKIKRIGNLDLRLEIIQIRRRKGIYKRALAEFQKNALDLIVDTQAEAIRILRKQMKSSDPKIAQRAALFFAEGARDMEFKRAEFSFEAEMQRRRITEPPPKTIVEVIMPAGVRALGDPPAALPAPPVVELDAQGNVTSNPPSPQQQASSPAAAPDKPAVSAGDNATDGDDELLGSSVL